jgi:group I intron endonuclease
MGFIYCYTSPENKKYIGLTRRTVEIRDIEHIKESKKKIIKPTRMFYIALIKFGRDNFNLTILEECDNDKLNFFEKFYIKEYNTLYPNGYNLTSGGSSGAIVTEEIRLVISKGLKNVHTDLPMYMTRHVKNDKTIGYSIHRHPKQPRQISFIVTNNEPEAYRKAIECLNHLNNLGSDEIDTKYIAKSTGGQRKTVESLSLPKYISPTKTKKGEYNGYKVQTYKDPLKYFRVPGENNIENAINYLNELMQKRMQLRE